MLANKAIRRVHDFTYLGSNVSEDGGTCKDVEIRIQKARGAFTRLSKIWLAHYINRYKDKTVQCMCKIGTIYMGAKPGCLHVKFRESFIPL
jgi:hypothetical protein